MNYRFDKRTKEQFLADIKSASRTEKVLLEKWLDKVQQKTGVRYAYQDTGSDNSGEYLESKDVTCKADFELEEIGPTEVKFSKTLIDPFHLKISQVKSYIKQDAFIIFFNGVETAKPEFTMFMSTDVLKMNLEEVNYYGFGGKLSYRIPCSLLDWWSL